MLLLLLFSVQSYNELNDSCRTLSLIILIERGGNWVFGRRKLFTAIHMVQQEGRWPVQKNGVVVLWHRVQSRMLFTYSQSFTMRMLKTLLQPAAGLQQTIVANPQVLHSCYQNDAHP